MKLTGCVQFANLKMQVTLQTYIRPIKHYLFSAVSVLTLLVGQLERHPTCINFTTKPLSHGSLYL